jgi:hypothetical protein
MDKPNPGRPLSNTSARERSHEDARQIVATNRMLVQSDGAATAALAYYGAHNASGQGLIRSEPISMQWTNELQRNVGIHPSCNIIERALKLGPIHSDSCLTHS